MKTPSFLSETSKSHPSEELFCIGITGTNGKTTVSYMIEHILKGFFKTGVIGSVDQHFEDKKWKSSLTTPAAPELCKRLMEFKSLGAEVAVLEVSSHALVQKRTAYMSFNALVFTHFSSDHLEYHKSIENYFLAKQSLFNSFSKESMSLESLQSFSSSKGKSSFVKEGIETKSRPAPCLFMPSSVFGPRPLFAVLNRDEPYVRRLLVSRGIEILTYGKKKNFLFSLDSKSYFPSLLSFSFEVLEEDLFCSRVEVEDPNGEKGVFLLPILGEYNVYNALAAIAVSWKIGVPFLDCLKLLSYFPGTPGRMQRIENLQGVNVFVDYAHTESALASVLRSFYAIKRKKKYGRIISVFGCGGDRDRQKRPFMAREAFEKSDLIFFTSDNPRNENPLQIEEDALKGLGHFSLQERERKWRTEMDREKAIFSALKLAKRGDIVLVAGKGHEKNQITKEGRKEFDDVEKIKEFFQLARKTTSSGE